MAYFGVNNNAVTGQETAYYSSGADYVAGTITNSAASGWREAFASCPFTVGMIFAKWDTTSSSVDDGVYLALGVGGAGSEESIWQFTVSGKSFTNEVWIPLPIHIAEGQRVAWRHELSTRSTRIELLLCKNNWGGLPPFAEVFDLTETKAFVAAGDPANTKGAWVEVVASCPYNLRGLFGTFSPANVQGTQQNFFDIAIGPAGSEEIIVADWHESGSTSEPAKPPRYFPVGIAEGERLAVRAQSSQTSNDAFDIWLQGIK